MNSAPAARGAGGMAEPSLSFRTSYRGGAERTWLNIYLNAYIFFCDPSRVKKSTKKIDQKNGLYRVNRQHADADSDPDNRQLHKRLGYKSTTGGETGEMQTVFG